MADAHGHTVTLQYSPAGCLDQITDAAGLQSMMQYFTGFGQDQVLYALTTPYGSTTFSNYLGQCVLVNEQGVARHLYLYEQQVAAGKVPTSYASYQPSTTGTGFSFANNFDSSGVDQRNSYYWGPRQYDALSSNFRNSLDSGTLDLTLLTATDYLMARQRHWLLAADQQLGQTLSLQREPSPDGTKQGQITWYDYPGKPSANMEGSLIQPSFVAQQLPNGQSRFVYYVRNAAGRATNVVDTYNDASGVVRVRTNVFVYAANNVDLLSVTNALGMQVERNIYTTTHEVATNFNGLNEQTVYTYSNGRVSSVSLPSGLVTTNIYGADGYLLETRDIGIRTNRYLWSNGLIAVHTNELGLAVTNTWDGLNRLRKQSFPDGSFITNVYDKLELVRVVDRMGFTHRFEYNSLRQRIRSMDALDRTNTFSFCPCGNLDSMTDPLNQTTSYTYDYGGRLNYVSYPDGFWIRYSLDLLGRATNIASADGMSTTNWYNNQGLLMAVSNAFGRVSATVYDLLDRATNVVDANGVTLVQTYDALGRLRTRTYPDTGSEAFGYSARGLTAYTNQIGMTNFYTYDPAGRRTYETNANWETTRFDYDPAGNLTSLVDGKSQSTLWKYNHYGLVTNKVIGGTEVFRYLYDLDGRLTNRWSAAKGDARYKYDAVGNLTNIQYAVSPAISLEYDKLNRVTKMMDGVGTSQYSYSAAGLLLSEDGPWDGDTVTLSYGNRLRTGLAVANPTGPAWVQSFAYDGAARLTNATSWAGSFGYLYDPDRALQARRLALPGGGYITNSYDSSARLLTTVLKNAQHGTLNAHQYAYNPANQRTQQVFTAGDYVNYTYDKIGQLKTALGKEPGGTTNRLHTQLGYAYDAAGNLNYRTNNALVQTFGVNALNQLTTVSRSGTITVAGMTSLAATNVTVNGLEAARYADRTFAKDGFSLADGNNTFTAIGKESLGRSDTNSVTVFLPASATYSYDLNGNLLSDGRRGFEYDDENQLTRVTVTNAWKSEFGYDGKLRRRNRKEFTWQGGAWVQTNEVQYVYDGNLVAQERWYNPQVSIAAPQQVICYTRGTDLSGSLQGAGGIGGLLARTDASDPNNPVSAFYHADGNGNVTALVNAGQVVVARYVYDPYGNAVGMSGPMAEANLYRFSSKELHPNSGLVYYLYRYYEPALQRWVNRDPIEEDGGMNLYTFVQNSPAMRVDAYGLDLCGDIESWEFKLKRVQNQIRSMVKAGVGDEPPNSPVVKRLQSLIRQERLIKLKLTELRALLYAKGFAISCACTVARTFFPFLLPPGTNPDPLSPVRTGKEPLY